MACSVCSANVEKKLQSLEGINSASVSLASRTALVDYAPDIISLEDMKREISNAGYDLVIENDRSVEEINRREFTLLRRRTLASWLFAILTMCFSMGWISLGMEQNMISDGGASAHHSSSFANQICLLLALANLLYCGKQFYVSAWKQLLHHTANMDSLVALSTLIAFLFSTFNTFFGEMVWGARGIEWHTYFDASVMIITFVLTGRCLEEKAKDSTASSIRQLMGMQPKTARLVTYEKIEGTNDYKMEEVPISTIQIGDMIEVRAGEKIPVDGVVTQAESFMTPDAAYVDEAMISGEPTPAMKKAGDNVLAGTIPSQGKLRMRAKQIGENTALAHIIRMVQEAQGSKAPVQRIVDKAALIFVPVVAAIALITFLAWWLIGGNAALPQAILSAVAVLVIACPCAMGLATPTALMVGIGKAAQKQILIKDASVPLYAFLAGGRRGVAAMVKNILRPAVTAFATQSSAATIPVNKEACDSIGVPKDVSDLVLPMGCTMHMDGSVLSSITKIAFLYGVFGMDFSGAGTYGMAIVVAILSAFVLSGAPGGGLVGEMLIVSMFNFPAEAFPIIATLGFIFDPAATCLNSSGDTIASMIVTRLVEGKEWLAKAAAAKKSQV